MRKNLFIYITSFFCGMSIMAIELSASRLLAPYFGTSSIIWTVIIGMIMISLSVGNVLGGRSADKHNSLGRLFSMIWIAAVWIAVIPLVGKYIVAGSVFLMMWILPNSLLVAGSVFSCLVVFSFPLVLLGMASPYLVKLGVKDMDNNGRTTGEIYATSTIGSIIGTFIPTFLTIPVIGTQKTFLVFSLVLNLICLYYFFKIKNGRVKSVITTVLVLALLFSPLSNSYAFWKKTVLEDESLYNYLQVYEDDQSVVLSTNVAFGVQSIYMKNKTLTGYYYDYSLMAPFFMKSTDMDKKFDVLVLGMGTGTYAKQCKRFFPNSSITGVEIDQKIVDLSKKYFDLTDQEAKVYVNDGRTFLSGKDAGMYDVIMIDAYHDITIPFHMATKEFFSEAKKHLNPGGVILVNINIRSEKNIEIEEYLTQTLKCNMNKVYKYNIPNITNTLVFASDDINCIKNLSDNITSLAADSPLQQIIQPASNCLEEVKDTKYVFTDDIAPVEVLGQKILDEIVANSLVDLKKELDSSGNGIGDILKMISGG
jgi:Spermidine synthase